MLAPISVIIPSYQAERYLPETLASVAAQTMRPQEVIVVNDGSTDRTEEIARLSGARILNNEHNLGLAESLNRGISNAVCEWLGFVDADDLWLPEKIERQWQSLEQMEDDQENTCIFSHIEQFISPDLSPEDQARIPIDKKILPAPFKSTLLAHRSVFERVGQFDSRWRVGEFIDWYARAKELNVKEIMLPEVLAKRRIHSTNMSRKDSSERQDMAKILLESIKRRRSKNP
ncbi:MAG: glycosyltransferase family 2 protein [Verrucomicrobiota bacterium]